MTENRERLEMLTLHKILITIFGLMLIYDYYHTTIPVIVRIPHPKFQLLGPNNISDVLTPVNDTYNQLINIKNFTFIVNPQPCLDYPAGQLLVVIVSSRPTNFANRKLIRNTWGRTVDSTKVVFMIGESRDAAVAHKIENESLIHGDIVQGNFYDAYRNMTYKHVMALKWVAHHCPMAKYILKTDDDMVVNSHAMRTFLAKELSPWGAKDLITCQVLDHAHIQRTNQSKWRVTPTEFSGEFYPTYCAGWAILYSQDVVPRLLTAAQNLPYFWIDDVHITGVCAQQIGVVPTPLTSLVLTHHLANLLTILGPHPIGPFLFGPPDISLDKISRIWRAIKLD